MFCGEIFKMMDVQKKGTTKSGVNFQNKTGYINCGQIKSYVLKKGNLEQVIHQFDSKKTRCKLKTNSFRTDSHCLKKLSWGKTCSKKISPLRTSFIPKHFGFFRGKNILVIYYKYV